MTQTTLRDIKIMIEDQKNYAGSIDLLHRFEYEFANNLDTLSIVNFFLGECYKGIYNYYEAERYYKKCIEMDNNVVYTLRSYLGLSLMFCEIAREDEAKDCLLYLKKSLNSFDTSAEINFKVGMINLKLGNFKDGWEGFEERFGTGSLKEVFEKEYFPRLKQDDDLNGKTLLIRYEQGYGDVIQYIRFAKYFKKMGAKKVDILTRDPLTKLLKIIDGVDNTITPKIKHLTEEELATNPSYVDRMDIGNRIYDYELMIMSAPFVLKMFDEKDIPNKPYIFPIKKDTYPWKQKLKKFTKTRVGLVWAGSDRRGIVDQSMKDIDNRRSINLNILRPLLDADCDFFSLQKDRSDDLKTFYGIKKIHDFMGEVNNFYDTACLIDNLDLVISVDTSTAHLAAAMGKPVWLLSRLDGCWRWMTNRDDTPWYPTMKIYRQTDFKDWQKVIKNVADDLKNFKKEE